MNTASEVCEVSKNAFGEYVQHSTLAFTQNTTFPMPIHLTYDLNTYTCFFKCFCYLRQELLKVTVICGRKLNETS